MFSDIKDNLNVYKCEYVDFTKHQISANIYQLDLLISNNEKYKIHDILNTNSDSRYLNTYIVGKPYKKFNIKSYWISSLCNLVIISNVDHYFIMHTIKIYKKLKFEYFVEKTFGDFNLFLD